MQISHSRIDCFNQCKRRFQYRYLDELNTLPDDKPDNALHLGTALHTGLEIGVEEAIQQYYSNYPIITDDHINEAIKLEAMIPKAKAMIPNGQNEVLIEDPDFKGFIDLLVPVGEKIIGEVPVWNDGFSPVVVNEYDIYDFKYSNNKQNYLKSDQLHLYKYFFEKNNPDCIIRNLYYLIVPKSKCKPFKGEDLVSYRNRLLIDLDKLTPELVPIEYDPNKVIQFLLETKTMLETNEYPKHTSYLCRYCEYYAFCEKGESYMLLPVNERRQLEGTTKKVIWVYGSPFSGKTTFANQFPDPLMLNTDGNIKFVDAPYIHIKDKVDTGRLAKRTHAWEIFNDVILELEKKENTFKTIVVDLLEDLYEHCRRYICDQKGWSHESDDSFRAWDMVRTEFLTVLKRLMNLDYENIILISHLDSTKDITKKGGDKVTAIKPNINDKIANKVAGMVDIVARAVADDGQHVLSFKRNEVIFGGGRLKFNATEIPLDYDAFCELYNNLSTEKIVSVSVTSSNAEKCPCEGHSDESNDTNSEITENVQEGENSTNSDNANVDNEPVRRTRKRRTE